MELHSIKLLIVSLVQAHVGLVQALVALVQAHVDLFQALVALVGRGQVYYSHVV